MTHSERFAHIMSGLKFEDLKEALIKSVMNFPYFCLFC